MSAKVSSFEKVKLGEYDYLFFVVAWSDYETSLTIELTDNVERFGENIGTKGLIVTAYDKNKWDTGYEIIAKDWGKWNEKIQTEQEPFLLVIDTDFATFDPLENNWIIFWINDYFNKKNAIPELLFSLETRLRKGENLFSHLEGMKSSTVSSRLVHNGFLNQTNQTYLLSSRAYHDQTLEKHLASIRKTVADGQASIGISLLKELDVPFQQEIAMLSNRYENFRLQRIRGVMSIEEQDVELRRIAFAVLELIEVIKSEIAN